MKNVLSGLLPSEYWAVMPLAIKAERDYGGNYLGLVVPVFGESEYIYRTMETFLKNQQVTPNLRVFVVLVIKNSGNDDTTGKEVERFVGDNPDKEIYVIQEETFPGKTCIGHARAIGFAYILNSLSLAGVDLGKVILMSADADTIDADGEYISKMSACFGDSGNAVVGAQNNLSSLAMERFGIRLLKEIEDGFFKATFRTVGTLNGRCYALRADAYLASGGVDYTAQFDDINFGIKVHKATGTDAYIWANTYVVTSERRFQLVIGKESLLDQYGVREALGNSKVDIEADGGEPTRLIEFARNHITEALNVWAHYYGKRYKHSDENLRLYEQQLKEYVNYLNEKIPEYRLFDLDMDRMRELFWLSVTGANEGDWWKSQVGFGLEVNSES